MKYLDIHKPNTRKIHRPAVRKSMAVIAIISFVAASSGVLTFLPHFANAADTGFVPPASASTANSYDDWSNPTRAFTSNNQYATENDESDEQGYEDFGFGIPADANVQGIEIEIEAKSSDASGCQIEAALSWNNGSNFTALKTAELSGSDASYALGGSADTWGHSWTLGELSNANFIARISYDDVSGTSCNNFGTTVSVDLIQAKVYYTPAVEPSANPELANSCGLDMALVLDSSDSMSNTDLTTIKSAGNALASVLLPGTPTEIGVIDFDTTVISSLAPTSNLTNVQNAIDSIGHTGGSGNELTNWDAALTEADSMVGAGGLVVIITDGNPTASNGPQSDLSDAVVAANTIKSGGTRMLAIGIDSSGTQGGLDVPSLEAIAGSQVVPPGSITDINDVDVFTGDISELQTVLGDLASALCGGTLTVSKRLDGQPAQGWQFRVTGPDFDQTFVTGVDGSTEAIPLLNGSYTIKETLQDGYEFETADCFDQNGSVGALDEINYLVSGVPITTDLIVSCIFQNTTPEPETGTLVVRKHTTGGDGVFTFDPSWSENDFQIVTGSGGGQSDTFNLLPDNYSVVEVGPPDGWLMNSNTCTQVEVFAGQASFCDVFNTFTPSVEEEGPGTINVCKIIINEQGQIVDGSEVAGAKFSIPWMDTTSDAGGSSEQPVPGETVFMGALTLNTDLVSDNESANDAECVALSGLEYGHYFYDEESIEASGAGETWAVPKYHDTFTGPIEELSDLLPYFPQLFNNDSSDDNERDMDADGDIVLSAQVPERTLIVLNQYTLAEEPDICEEVELLTNRGFEVPEVEHEDGWDIFSSVSGWTIAWLQAAIDAGAPGSGNLEVQEGVSTWTASEGDQYAELDTDWGGPDNSDPAPSPEPSNVSVSQTVPTELGFDYKLTFDFSPRPGVADNQIAVYWNGVQQGAVISADGLALANPDWNTHTLTLVGTGADATLEFREVGEPDSFGSFLDNVSLTKICPDPEEEPPITPPQPPPPPEEEEDGNGDDSTVETEGQTSGGGSGGSGGGGSVTENFSGSGGSSGTPPPSPTPAPTPSGEVAGAQTTADPGVGGATLPRTGMSADVVFMILATGVIAVFGSQRKSELKKKRTR